VVRECVPPGARHTLWNDIDEVLWKHALSTVDVADIGWIENREDVTVRGIERAANVVVSIAPQNRCAVCDIVSVSIVML